MVFSRVDRDELLLTLYALDDAMPFALFLERLRRRTCACEAFLIVCSGAEDWKSYVSAGASTAPLPPLSRQLLQSLRAGRLYDLQTLDEVECGASIRASTNRGDVWLGIRGGSASNGFDATDGALLSALAPHVLLAFTNLARLHDSRIELAAAQAALDRAGVGWALLDEEGEPGAQPGLDATPRQRAALIAAVRAGAEIASAGQTIALPLEPAGQGTALALYRKPITPIDRSTAFAAAYGLTKPEARMAVALAEGASIVEAAAMLNITEQTARHYSKRLYTATGTRGQADLVRLFWTSAAALA